MWCTMILFRYFLQEIVRLRMCAQCWQSKVEPHLAGKLLHQGIEVQHKAATYPSTCLQWPSSHHTWFFFCGGLLRTRSTGHQYVIWQTYKKQFMLLSTMSHHRCFITHGLRLNSGWAFPVPLMETILTVMEYKFKKSQFSLFVAMCFIYRFVLVQKL